MNNRTRNPHYFANRKPPTFTHEQSYHTPYYPNSHQTPYERYAKPPQPLDLMSPNQEAYENPQGQTQAGFFRAFTDANGQVDFDKTMATINQLASTYHQVSPIVRQVSALVKMFR